MTLYQRLLGARFALLHPVLQRFHGRVAGSGGRGDFRVRRLGGWLANRLADILRLPAAGDNVPVELAVVPEGDGERWLRRFGSRDFTTLQWQAHDLLVESSGPVRFGLEPNVKDSGLEFRTRKVWFLGLPVPWALAPAVEAQVAPDELGWAVAVEVRLPILGPLLQYEGRLIPR